MLRISITPTYSKDKNKVQNGYCGVTEVIEENVEVPISMSTKLIKLLAITRMPFTSASLLPIFLTASYFYSINSNSFSLINFSFVLSVFYLLTYRQICSTTILTILMELTQETTIISNRYLEVVEQ